MFRSLLVVLVVLAATLPAAAYAQRGGASPPFDGPRGEYMLEMSDGEPVSFYLEWARLLELTGAQKDGLIEIRRKLRLVNAPHMNTLDSLREAAGVSLHTRGRLRNEDREALERFRLWSVPVTESIRRNNDGARREIRALLTDGQLVKADSLHADMRSPSGGRPSGRRSGGQAGRRPEAPLETPETGSG